MAPWRRFSWLLVALLFALGRSPGRCDRLHVHDMSLVNKVDGFTCQPGRLYKDAMPRGIAQVSVDHVKALGTDISAEQCLSNCCKLGQKRCQYLWVFGEACFAIGCEDDVMNCMPQLLPSNVKTESIYVKMQYLMKENDLDNIEETLDEQLLEKGKDGDDNDNDKGHPPVVNAGGDVTVQLPADIVHLYGNGSTGYNGIKVYSWELVSDHFVRPILENPGSPVLQIKNLIPGNYTFRLTVTDTDGRSSSSVVMVYALEGTVTTGAVSTPSHPETTVGQTSLTSHANVNESKVDAEGNKDVVNLENSDEAYYRKRRIVLKIVVPVLVSVAVILILSAVIVGLSACLCERNRRRMRRFYRYKKLPDTIAKT